MRSACFSSSLTIWHPGRTIQDPYAMLAARQIGWQLPLASRLLCQARSENGSSMHLLYNPGSLILPRDTAPYASLPSLQEELGLSQQPQQEDWLAGMAPRAELLRKLYDLASSAEYLQLGITAFPAPDDLRRTQIKLSHIFNTPMLLKLALLHSSASSAANNSLAWIGDAALHLVVSEQLCARYPSASIGDLAKVRSYLISRHKFTESGLRAGLDKVAVVGKSVRSSGPMPNSLIAEMYEAVIGAVYVDAGLQRCRAVYLHMQPMPKTFKELWKSVPPSWGAFTSKQ